MLCKQVGGSGQFREVTPADLEARLELLSLSPVHFEELPEGELARLVVIGEHVQLLPDLQEVPESLRESARRLADELDLVLLEIPVRRLRDGRWLASGLHRFLSPEVLSEPALREKTCELLEAGR
jgi:hypothetical protein